MMNIYKKKIFLLILLVLILIFPRLTWGTQIINKSADAGSLKAKWDITLKNGQKINKGFWIAYSVDRLMGENTYFISSSRITGCISTSSFSNTFDSLKGISLGKLIYGKDPKVKKTIQKSEKDQIKDAAKMAIVNIRNKGKRYKYKKVNKEVALLFFFKPGLDQVPQLIRHTNMIFPFESKGQPVYWLGKTDEKTSFKLLKGIFYSLGVDKTKRRLISAISHNSNSQQVITFLAKVVNSNESDRVRSRAAGELGDQDNPAAVNILLNIAKNDYSIKVRKKAVNALEDLNFPSTVDALIDIANTANNIYIREKAINTLGDVGSKKAAKALNNIAFEDINLNIQRKAVNAFEDLPDKEGVPYLIKIAKKHPNSYIRKKALDCLSDIDDERAFEAIKAIASEK